MVFQGDTNTPNLEATFDSHLCACLSKEKAHGTDSEKGEKPL